MARLSCLSDHWQTDSCQVATIVDDRPEFDRNISSIPHESPLPYPSVFLHHTRCRGRKTGFSILVVALS